MVALVSIQNGIEYPLYLKVLIYTDTFNTSSIAHDGGYFEKGIVDHDDDDE